MKGFFRIGLILVFCILVGCSGEMDNGKLKMENGKEIEGIEEIKDSQRGGTPLQAEELEGTEATEGTEDRVAFLQEAYDDARIVQEAVEDVWEEFDLQEQEVLSDVLAVFSDDILLLGYYIEVAEFEQLTEEDEQNIVEIVIGIQDAIFILTQALDTLL